MNLRVVSNVTVALKTFVRNLALKRLIRRGIDVVAVKVYSPGTVIDFKVQRFLK